MTRESRLFWVIRRVSRRRRDGRPAARAPQPALIGLPPEGALPGVLKLAEGFSSAALAQVGDDPLGEGEYGRGESAPTVPPSPTPFVAAGRIATGWKLTPRPTITGAEAVGKLRFVGHPRSPRLRRQQEPARTRWVVAAAVAGV